MPSTPAVIVVAMLLMLVLLIVFTSISVALVALTSWLLALITPLSYSQAALVSGITSILVIYLSQRELFVSVPATLILVLTIVPLASLVFVTVAWGLDHSSPLDFWQASLLAMGVGLVVLYGLTHHLNMSTFGSEFDGDWDKDDEEE